MTSSARRPPRAIAPSAVEQQRRLPDARLAADEDERGRHETAAEHAVELGNARWRCARPRRPRRRRAGRAAPDARRRPGRRAVQLLDERPERAAAGALSEPAARRRAALGAGELDGDLGHRASLGARSDAVRHESAPVRLQVGRECDKSAGRPPQTTTKGRVAWTDSTPSGAGRSSCSSERAAPHHQLLQLAGGRVRPRAARRGSAGVSAWDGFRGIVMGLLTIVLIAWIVARLAAVDIPIPVSFAMTSVGARPHHRRHRDPQEPHRRLLDVLELHRRRARHPDRVGAWLEVQDAGGVGLAEEQRPAASDPHGQPPRRRHRHRPAAAAPAAAAPVPPRHPLRDRITRECGERSICGQPRSERTASDDDGCGLGRNAATSRRPSGSTRARSPPHREAAARQCAAASSMRARCACKSRISDEGEYPVAKHSGPAAARRRSHAERVHDGEVQEPSREARRSSSSPGRCCSSACSSPGRTSRSTTGGPEWPGCRSTAGTPGASCSHCSFSRRLTLVVLTNLTEVEMSSDVPWATVTFGLGVATFAVAVAQEPHRRRLVLASYGFVALAAAVAVGHVPRLGRRAPEARAAPVGGGSAAGSDQPLDEQHAVFARPVVVLGDPLDLEPERLVERHRALVHR